MAVGKHTVTISVLADTRKFTGAMRDVGNTTGLNKLGAGFKKAAKTVAVFTAAVGAAAVAAGVKAVNAAGDLEQSIGAVDTVFKTSADQMHKWATDAHKNVGLSKNDYNELATLMGTQLKNGGIALDQMGGKTNELITLGADLSSMFGGTAKDAVGALSSALKGERDPIEKYGVSLKQATIDAKAAEMGFTKVGGSLSNEANQAATLALIMEQTADAHGNFGRESKTLQGLTQRLKSRFENLWATLGMKLLPVVSKVVDWFSQKLDPALAAVSRIFTEKVEPAIKRVTEWFKENQAEIQALAAKIQDALMTALTAAWEILGKVSQALQTAGEWMVKNREWLIPLTLAVVAAVAAYQAVAKVTAIITAVKTAMALARPAILAFNTALLANPIGLIIAAVAALAAGLTYFFTQTETGRKVWETVWGAIQTGFQAFMDWIRPVIDDLASAWQVTWERIQMAWDIVGPPLMEIIKTAIELLKNNIKTTLDVLKAVWETIWNSIKIQLETIMGVIKGIIKTVTSIIKGDWKGAWEGIKQIFGSIINGIKAQAQNIFNGIVNVISSLLNGLLSNIKSIITGIKNFITNGLSGARDGAIKAMRSMRDGAIDQAKSMLDWIRELPSRILRIFTNAPSMLKNAGKQVIDGFLGGIRGGFDRVRSSLAELTSWLPDWKGPAKRDKVILKDSGTLVMAGFLNGLEKSYTKVRRSLGDFTGSLGGGVTVTGKTLGTPFAGSPAIVAAAPTQFNITVQTGVGDPLAIAREIKRLLEEYDRMNGGR